MLLPNRNGNAGEYRYGFQGQEKDDEIKGEGNSLNYTFRMHDPRLGRFFAVDPLAPKYPHYTPYSFSGNKVIAYGELEGLEEYSVVTNGGRKIRMYKVRPTDNLSVISEITGVAKEDILRYSQVPEGADIVYPQTLILEDVSAVTMKRFQSWSRSFLVELATSNENGPSVQSSANAVFEAELYAAGITLFRAAFKGVLNRISKYKGNVKAKNTTKTTDKPNTSTPQEEYIDNGIRSKDSPIVRDNFADDPGSIFGKNHDDVGKALETDGFTSKPYEGTSTAYSWTKKGKGGVWEIVVNYGGGRHTSSVYNSPYYYKITGPNFTKTKIIDPSRYARSEWIGQTKWRIIDGTTGKVLKEAGVKLTQ